MCVVLVVYQSGVTMCVHRSSAECVCVAIQAVEDIQMRSEYDLLPELLHLCYAITHALKRDNIVLNGRDSIVLNGRDCIVLNGRKQHCL